MKKRSLKLLACATMLTLAFSLGACSSDKESDKDSDKKTEAPSSTENKKSDKAYSSMKDFVESDELQSQIKPLTDSLAGSGIELEIKADGNKFIYSFKCEALTKEDEAQIEQELTAQQSTYKGLASELTKSVDVEDPIVVVEYLDLNGEVIHSQEFTAD